MHSSIVSRSNGLSLDSTVKFRGDTGTCADVKYFVCCSACVKASFSERRNTGRCTVICLLPRSSVVFDRVNVPNPMTLIDTLQNNTVRFTLFSNQNKRLPFQVKSVVVHIPKLCQKR